MGTTKLEYKKLKSEEAVQYISEHHGKKHSHPSIYFCNLYDCDNSTVILENTKEKKFTLYLNKEKYYQGLQKVARLSKENPLAGKQFLINEIGDQKTVLIAYLFSELNLQLPSKLKNVNLLFFVANTLEKKKEEVGLYKSSNPKTYLCLLIRLAGIMISGSIHS